MTIDSAMLKLVKEKILTCDDRTLREAFSMIIDIVVEKEHQIDDLIENYYKIASLLEKLGLAKLNRSEMGSETTEE